MNNKYPKVMMVSDEPITKSNPGQQRVVWAYNPKLYHSYFTYPSSIKTLKDVENIPYKTMGWGWLIEVLAWKYT
jgi:hypothetical protein